jgi:SAM-dependent methyltransferase
MELDYFIGRSPKLGVYDRHNYLLSHIPSGCGKCLDVGGAVVKEIKESIINKGYKYFNADLRKCKGSVQADSSCLPFKNNIFSIIILSYVIGYVYEWKQAIKDISRILSREGAFYFTDSMWSTKNNYFKPISLKNQPNKIIFPKNDEHGYMWEISTDAVINECFKNGLILTRYDIRFDWHDCFLIFQKE